eukprot:TRINITY_DN6895_c3_g1_i2.p1 TRINITY_DN6895_c3_g1~~TRINITY_DN6895_c3_g1_i2.p1  ORF type:complete len:445 (-),score=73.88 TRINITY_DN6895_c3_g1_i2:403-1737(-)
MFKNMSGFLASIDDVMRAQNENVLSALVPLMKLLSITVIGLILAHPKTKIVPRATFKLLSKLVFALFLPCLIFIHLGRSISLSNITHWWFIPVNVILSTVIGCILGYLVALVCCPPPEFFRFTVIMTGFGNTGNLPIAIVGSVCHSPDNLFGHDCQTKGNIYVSFAQWVAVILVYTVVYHMMEPPMAYYEIISKGNETEEPPTNDMSKPLLVEAEWPGMEDKETEHLKAPSIATAFRSLSGTSQTDFPDLDLTEGGGSRSPTSIRCLAEPRVVRKIRIVAEQTPVQHILQPPTIASLLAIIVGLVPTFKDFVFGEDAPLRFFSDSLEILAAAVVPSVMLILGGMLAEGPYNSGLGIRTTIGIMLARLLVLPLLGIGSHWQISSNLLVPADKMYKFVLSLQYTTPSAILLGAIASLRGYAVREASAILFWQHIFAVVSLSVYITV